MGDLAVSHRLHVSAGTPDRRDQLPELPGSTQYHETILDRAGQGMQQLLPVVLGAGIGGGVLGSKLLRGSTGGIVRGVLGALGGTLGGLGVGLGVVSLRSSTPNTLPDVPADASEASTDVATREHVKVMTWNLHGGMGGPGELGSSEEDLDALAAEIRREDPDIVVMQEVDRDSVRSNWKDTLGELSGRLHATSAIEGANATSVLGRDQSVAVMTFHGFEVSDARNVIHEDPEGEGVWARTLSKLNEFAGPVDEHLGTHLADGTHKHVERNSIDTIVRTPGGTDLRVLSGHYEWANPRFDAQQHEVGALATALAAWRGPTILGADFNAAGGGDMGVREHELMGTAGLHDTWGSTPLEEQDTAVDHPTRNLDGGIDRIYASHHATVLETHVARDAGDASDHLPVVTELELQPGS